MNIKRIWSTITGVLVLTMTLIVEACAPNIAMLKGDVDAFQPLIEYEISVGHLAPVLAEKLTRDGKLLLDDFGILTANWGGSKALALGTFAGQVLPITNDFRPIPHLNEAMLVLNTTIAIVRAYYDPHSTPPGLGPSIPKSDSELNAFMKAQRAKLKEALAAR